MKKLSLIIGLFLIINLAGCGNNAADTIDSLEETIADLNQMVTELEAKNDALNQQLDLLTEEELPELETTYLEQALSIVLALKNKDFTTLTTHIHPEKGLQFTPYASIDIENDLTFPAEMLLTLSEDDELYTWGVFDGTGDPIHMTFNDYYDRFIFDADFSSPEMIGNNISIGTGNSIDNIEEIYPNGRYVEFHFSGFEEQYAGMDWRSLRLIFESFDGTYYLVGIVHDEWTS